LPSAACSSRTFQPKGKQMSKNSAPTVTMKKFVAVPRDAFDCLARRHASFDEAVADGTDYCGETGMSVFVIELKAVVSRADKPVTVKKL
jgi:hypothetical protein